MEFHQNSMKRFFCISGLLSLLWLLSGCIEFEDQEVRWRYLPEEDAIVAVLRYQGIYGGEGKRKADKTPGKQLTEGEIKQLTSVMQGGRAFFFGNWISEFNRNQIEKGLEEFADVPEGIDSRLMNLLLKEVKVANVGFYVDEKGWLCGAQTFQIDNGSDLLDLTNKKISDEVLKKIRKDVGEDNDEEGDVVDVDKKPDYFSLSAVSMMKKLKRVEYEQMRLSGITRINGEYRIHIEDIRARNRFWLKEGTSHRGFKILEVKPEEGFARITKNGQAAKVYLRSKEIVADTVEKGPDLEMLQLMANRVESGGKFLTKDSGGITFRFPVTAEELEKGLEENPVPEGMTIEHKDNEVTLRMSQAGRLGGVLRKKCYPGYVPNALDHVRKKYGRRDKIAVDKELQDFLTSGR